jgi:hypothetical protein
MVLSIHLHRTGTEEAAAPVEEDAAPDSGVTSDAPERDANLRLSDETEAADSFDGFSENPSKREHELDALVRDALLMLHRTGTEEAAALDHDATADSAVASDDPEGEQS